MSIDPWNVLTAADVVSIIEDHWPDIGGDISDSTWVMCVCGWDSSNKGAVDWHQHLVNAVDEAVWERSHAHKGVAP